MPTTTLRPNSTYNTPESVTGAATAHAATLDELDTTYFTIDGLNPGCGMHLETFSLPAGAVTDQVRVRVRAKEVSGGGIWFALRDDEWSAGSNITVDDANTTTSWVTYSGDYVGVSLLQADLDGMSVYLVNDIFGIGGAVDLAVSRVYVDVDYALQPGTPTVSAPTGSITTTRRPLVNWAFVAGTDGPTTQARFRVKIFDDATYGGGGFDPDTSIPVMDSGLQTSATTQWTPSADLDNNDTYKAYVLTYAELNGVIQESTDWGISPAFTMAIPVPTPTNVEPFNLSTHTSPTPAMDAGGGTSLLRTKREWQIASNTGFSTNLQTFQEEILRTTHTGAGAFVFDGTALAQGTWYVRARLVGEYGTNGSYATYNTFDVSHPPSAAISTPSGGNTYLWDTTPRISWNFSDDYGLDSQSAYQVEFWQDGDKVGTLVDSTKSTNTVHWHDVATIGVGYKDVLLRTRVKVWDQDDIASAWSGETTFYLRDVPTATITFPTTTVAGSQPTVTWTFSAGGGRVQDKYRVIVTDTTNSVVVEDSGTITDPAALEYTLASAVIIPGNTYSFQLDLTDDTGLLGTDTNAGITTTFGLPATPDVRPDGSAFLGTGGVYLDWSASTIDANVLGWKAYRRLLGNTTWTLIYDGATEATTYSWTDYTCPSESDVEYSVTQIVDNFSGGTIESAHSIHAFQGTCDKYFLVVPLNHALNIQLFHVTGDSFDDEQEMATINLIGRGRRVEYGTRFGQRGSLTVNFRDNSFMTARQQRLWIESLRGSGEVIYLRNPFGDVWEVALFAIPFSRTPGVGLREHGSMTIEYVEVTA